MDTSTTAPPIERQCLSCVITRAREDSEVAQGFLYELLDAADAATTTEELRALLTKITDDMVPQALMHLDAVQAQLAAVEMLSADKDIDLAAIGEDLGLDADDVGMFLGHASSAEVA